MASTPIASIKRGPWATEVLGIKGSRAAIENWPVFEGFLCAIA